MSGGGKRVKGLVRAHLTKRYKAMHYLAKKEAESIQGGFKVWALLLLYRELSPTTIKRHKKEFPVHRQPLKFSASRDICWSFCWLVDEN
jgi:hypothetical protein